MKKYTCIIVDDEILARELIGNHLSKVPEIVILASCASAIEAKFALEKHQPDILFLDIAMPNLTGIELLRMLKKRPATILTTAYSKYAIEGYELDVLDYLLKPIEFDRFFKAVSKVFDWLEREKNSDQQIVTHQASKEEYFFVKADYKIVKVYFKDILFIEALQKYVRIHCVQERIVTLMSMSHLEENLPKAQFIRIHRSHIINVDKIQSIEGNIVHIDRHQLPISKGQREVFLDRIGRKMFGQ